MTLQTKDITIDDGRDAGKVFRITELPADAGEWWAIRLGGLIMEADKNNELLGLVFGGMDALAELGPVLVIKFALMGAPEKLKPLLDEMEECWGIVNPAKPNVVMPLAKNSIEDKKTRLFLRMETLKFFLDFFPKKDEQNSKG